MIINKYNSLKFLIIILIISLIYLLKDDIFNNNKLSFINISNEYINNNNTSKKILKKNNNNNNSKKILNNIIDIDPNIINITNPTKIMTIYNNIFNKKEFYNDNGICLLKPYDLPIYYNIKTKDYIVPVINTTFKSKYNEINLNINIKHKNYSKILLNKTICNTMKEKKWKYKLLYKKEEIESVFLKEELDPNCYINSKLSCCCIGSVSQGSIPTNKLKLYKNFSFDNYNLIYKPLLRKTPHNFADVLDLITNKLLKSKIKIPKVVFLGDSVTLQGYIATICSINRSLGVRVIENNLQGLSFQLNDFIVPFDNRNRFPITEMKHTVEFYDKNTQIIKKKVEVICIKQYTPSTKYTPIPIDITLKYLCGDLDYKNITNLKKNELPNVIILNFGIHYPYPIRQQYYDDIYEVRSYIKQCYEKTGIRIYFRETTSQHFMNNGGEYDRKIYKNGCRSIKFNNFNMINFRTNYLMKFKNNKNIDSKNYVPIQFFDNGATKVCSKKDSDKQFYLKIIPYYSTTAQLSVYHVTPCTHFQYTPYIWTSLWDNLYNVILSDTIETPNTCIDVPQYSNYPEGPYGIEIGNINNIDKLFLPTFDNITTEKKPRLYNRHVPIPRNESIFKNILIDNFIEQHT